MHFNPHLWKDPLRFDPERFAPGGELETMPSTYAYLPFSSGSRQCIGSLYEYSSHTYRDHFEMEYLTFFILQA